MTCKKKRLKCDETKPSCLQCQKRSVVCEGYKKDYKWRSFEETTFTSKPTARKKTFRSSSFTTQPRDIHSDQAPQHPSDESQPAHSWSPSLNSAFATAAHAFQSSSPEKDADLSATVSPPPPPPPPHVTPDPIYLPSFDAHPIPHQFTFPDTVEPYNLTTASSSSNNDNASPRSSASPLSSDSPQLLDLLLPGTGLGQPPDLSDLGQAEMSPLSYQPPGFDPPRGLADGDPADEDFDEEIVREPFSGSGLLDSTDGMSWTFRQPSPTPSATSSSSSTSSNMTLLAQPQLDASSPEMLMLRFDKQTCGILSVKDGPTENPWRTLIWPLAQDSPALYHAISSMTAFHGAHEVPHLHVPGMAHMTKSIKRLAFEIENMRLDSALATSLALAFGEGWDRHVSTGIQHLRGAKVMVNNAVVKHRRDFQLGQLVARDAMRLKFLCNTFVYMDVIARLTSLEEASDLNFEDILTTVNHPFGDLAEVDPLLGCALSLFPLIGRVANLIQRIRKTETNSLALVSQGLELKEALQRWQIPSVMLFERPEDPHSEVQHSIQTAEAYRTATLLYLHQAVPEIPSEPASVLAQKVLMTLASVPLSSRTTVVQIFPLFAASCEMTSQEDRSWVMQRWASMIARLKIGNVTACWNVIQEVWARRDAFEAEKTSRLLRRYTSRGVAPTGLVVPGRSAGKRNGDVLSDDMLFSGAFDGQGDPFDSAHRPLKRRLTLDSGTGGIPSFGPFQSGSVVGTSRQSGDTATTMTTTDQLEREYTVRGKLHWLGVMGDWHWEGMLHHARLSCSGLVTDTRFGTVFLG